MARAPEVTRVHYVPAGAREARAGLLGWAKFTLDGLYEIDGAAVRRTRAGRLALYYPENRSRGGGRHRVVWPLDAEARREIERAVLEAAGFDGEAVR